MNESTSFTVVIPARYGSTRLPGKPLIDLCGKPMIQRVAEQALKSDAKRVVIATDDQRIADALEIADVEVVMTHREHVSGTDRIWEVVENSDLASDDTIVNVQGDEPLIPPAVINQVAELVIRDTIRDVGTLCERIRDTTVAFNPNAVKVVFDTLGRALYFSRAPIPWERDRFGESKPEGLVHSCFRHIGIYAYRKQALKQFVNWEVGELEKLESLEQLRFLENGVAIHIEEVQATVPAGVDTVADAEAVREFLRDGPG